MKGRAETKYIRISPTKARLVADLIRGMNVERALAVLKATNKKGAFYFEKTLRSAVANAKQKDVPENTLIISHIVANPGPTLKRYRAASFGRGEMIRKRTAHIVVEVSPQGGSLEGKHPGQKIVKKKV